jgi:hypothetical protein
MPDQLMHRTRAALIGKFVKVDGEECRGRTDEDVAFVMAVDVQNLGRHDVFPTMIFKILEHADLRTV